MVAVAALLDRDPDATWDGPPVVTASATALVRFLGGGVGESSRTTYSRVSPVGSWARSILRGRAVGGRRPPVEDPMDDRGTFREVVGPVLVLDI